MLFSKFFSSTKHKNLQPQNLTANSQKKLNLFQPSISQPIPYYYGKLALLQEIKETKASIELAQSNFEYMTNPDLVDCAIYELKAAQKRYAYLLECAKKYDMTCLYDQVIS